MAVAANADPISDLQATIADLQSRISGIQSAVDSATSRWSAQVSDANSCTVKLNAANTCVNSMMCESLDLQAAMSKHSIDLQQQSVDLYNFEKLTSRELFIQLTKSKCYS